MRQQQKPERHRSRYRVLRAEAARAAESLGLYVLPLPADTRAGAERWAVSDRHDGREVLSYFPDRLPQGFLWTCGRERGYVRHWRAALAEAGRRATR
jgi:hypothetical protein